MSDDPKIVQFPRAKRPNWIAPADRADLKVEAALIEVRTAIRSLDRIKPLTAKHLEDLQSARRCLADVETDLTRARAALRNAATFTPEGKLPGTGE